MKQVTGISLLIILLLVTCGLIVRSWPIPDMKKQATAYCDTAIAQAKAGNMAEARKTFDQAKKAALQIKAGFFDDEPWDDRAQAYLAIAKAQAKVGDVDGVRKTLDQTKEIVARIYDPRNGMSWCYGDIATAQAKMGDIAEAKKTVMLIPSSSRRAEAEQAMFAAYQANPKVQKKAGDKAGEEETRKLIKAIEK